MLYHVKRKEENKKNISNLVKHPYFGFVILGIFMLVSQLLYYTGLIGISTMRAFGQTMVFIIVGLGFSILLGYAGLASLGTAGFVGIGAYSMGYFFGTLGLPFIVTLIISFIGAIIIGGIVGFISLRIEGMYLGIITLGLAEILVEVFKNGGVITNGTNGLQLARDFSLFGIEFDREQTFIFIILMLIITMILTLNIMRSPTGRAMSAMKNSDSAAQAMGISIFKYRLLAFIISTVYAVFAGILYTSYIEFTIPGDWTLAFSLNILAAVVVGGARSILGVVLGVFMIFGLNLAVLQKIPYFIEHSNVNLIFNGILIIVVVMFYPGGLNRLVISIKNKLVPFYKKMVIKYKEYRYGKDE